MVINENNSQINAFAKGMNSDTAYDQIENQQYVFGKNIRITKNDFVGGTSGDVASLHEGVITPIPEEEKPAVSAGKYDGEYLASGSIDDIVVVITYKEGRLFIYRCKLTDKNPSLEIWCKIKIDKTISSASIVIYQELTDVIKLYIATGEYPIIELRIDDKGQPVSETVDDYINNRILPTKPIKIINKIDGSLKTSQVQYTYRFYNKFGITTQLAPLTNKIQVIDDNRNKEVGNAQDSTTSIGFRLKISEYPSVFDRLQIFRLSYINPGEDAEVTLIFDGACNPSSGFEYNDVGTVELQKLTMEEFAAMSGMVIIPKVIEQNQQYLFASNVKDDTIIQDDDLNLVAHGNVIPVVKQVTISTSVDDAPVQSSSSFKDQEIKSYLASRNIEESLVKDTYNNIFTSSLLRSLRRGEKYRYGIVYYDKYGRHSNVIPILSDGKKYIQIPEITTEHPLTSIVNGQLKANVYGVNITIPQPSRPDIIGCQIVRRSSKPIYQKALLQVALSRPIRQNLYETSLGELQFQQLRDATADKTNNAPSGENKSPYYPSGFLFINQTRITRGYYCQDRYGGVLSGQPDRYGLGWAQSDAESKLFQVFSQEIDFRRDDVLSKLKSSTLSVCPKFQATLAVDNAETFEQQSKKHQNTSGEMFSGSSIIYIEKADIRQTGDSKSSEYMVFPLYYVSDISHVQNEVKNIKDTKQPTWYDGFSNLQLAPNQNSITSIGAGAIKKYKQFTTNIENTVYNNWISFGLYDLRISSTDSQPNVDGESAAYIAQFNTLQERDEISNTGKNYSARRGYIGPGPSCFIMSTDRDIQSTTKFGTAICNLEHTITEGDNEPDEFVQYFGFGNFFELTYNEAQNKYLANNNTDSVLVFDGDIYITPHEITTMYKTYDFMSYDTLQSMQITNYVPMESKVNTFFDYGMNFLNTNSTNLMLEAGSIEGITTQDRPAHQYNQIYSANDESNDVFSLATEEPQDNNFKQRTYYSEPKTNGEYVDNFVIFKPASYIDVDPKYGEVTNLLTDKNTLYYWQESAFGKFSVNERSLVNDQNGNTIMLGQAGILSRNDYISTKYGMRMYDFCATCAENGVFWVDVNNKAVVGADSNQAINLGEVRNVQNIINRKIVESIPRVDYDLQNNELLCKCLEDGEQIVFNLKINAATSVYTRRYEDIINVHNHLYGLYVDDQNILNGLYKYNYIKENKSYLNPIELSFVVNTAASTTKVFDSQMLVPAKRRMWNGNEPNYTNLVFSFETDINKTTNSVEKKTDREGNIIYNIPRFGTGDYGNRMRGKWMRVNISTNNPDQFTTVSHVITKFRQSYS